MVGGSLSDRKTQRGEIHWRRQLRSDREAPLSRVRDGTSWPAYLEPEPRPRIRLYEGALPRLLHGRWREPVGQDSAASAAAHRECFRGVRVAERLRVDGR